MYDLLYVAGTIVFFALILLYLAGCRALEAHGDTPSEDAR